MNNSPQNSEAQVTSRRAAAGGGSGVDNSDDEDWSGLVECVIKKNFYFKFLPYSEFLKIFSSIYFFCKIRTINFTRSEIYLQIYRIVKGLRGGEGDNLHVCGQRIDICIYLHRNYLCIVWNVANLYYLF